MPCAKLMCASVPVSGAAGSTPEGGVSTSESDSVAAGGDAVVEGVARGRERHFFSWMHLLLRYMRAPLQIPHTLHLNFFKVLRMCRGNPLPLRKRITFSNLELLGCPQALW
eukprot:3106562-Rhodomonas_salina.1